MNHDMTKPCDQCPFRTDRLRGWLGEERAEEIAESITDRQQSFPCHKTVERDEDGECYSKDEQMCAGAMILLEKLTMPTQMMRIMERLRMYDRRKLDMAAPVFDSVEDFIRHHGDKAPKRRQRRKPSAL